MDQSMDQSTWPWIGNLKGCRCRAVGRHVYAVGRHVHGCIDRSTCLWTYPWTCLWHLTYTHYIYIIHYSISHYTKKMQKKLVLGVAHQGEDGDDGWKRRNDPLVPQIPKSGEGFMWCKWFLSYGQKQLLAQKWSWRKFSRGFWRKYLKQW